MKNTSLLLILLFSGCLYNLKAQNITCFDYDAAGNRIKRYQCCVNCSFTGASEDRDAISEHPDLLSIKALPNPNTGTFTLVGADTPAAALIQVLDVSGHLLLEKRFENGYVDLSKYSNGLYFVRVSHESKHRTLRVEKME